MDNSEKLSLFRKGNSNGIGLTDVPLPPQLSLNKEVIANLNDEYNSENNMEGAKLTHYTLTIVKSCFNHMPGQQQTCLIERRTRMGWDRQGNWNCVA